MTEGAGLHPAPRRTRRVWIGQTVLLLLAFAIAALLRMPAIVREGRFWAEEGRYFFESAWVLPPTAALFHTVGGYLNLLANMATLASRYGLPLRDAPYGTIATALAVQLLPPFLLLTARDPWLQPLPVRVAATASLLFASSSDEIWLQTLHCQFELTLAGAIVLCLGTDAGRAACTVRLVVLALAPLCGLGAAALVPLFALRVLLDRDRRRLAQLLAIGGAVAVQVLLFYAPGATRSYSLTPERFAAILYVRHLVLPFEGVERAAIVAARLRAALADGRVPRTALGVVSTVLVLATLASLRRPAPRPALWLLGSGLATAALSYFGAIGDATALIDPRFGERYAFVPSALFGLALVALAATGERRWVAVPALLVVWSIAMGAAMFFDPWQLMARGPDWAAEVLAWRGDGAHRLRIWPDGWTMRLDPAHHALDP